MAVRESHKGHCSLEPLGGPSVDVGAPGWAAGSQQPRVGAEDFKGSVYQKLSDKVTLFL